MNPTKTIESPYPWAREGLGAASVRFGQRLIGQPQVGTVAPLGFHHCNVVVRVLANESRDREFLPILCEHHQAPLGLCHMPGCDDEPVLADEEAGPEAFCLTLAINRD